MEESKLKAFTRDIENGALKQALNIAKLPFLHKWVALMPDTHQGYGMPIGGVAGLVGVVSPNMVGVDIGCGMCAVNTHISVDDATQEKLKLVMAGVRKTVPVGFAHHKEPQPEHTMPVGIVYGAMGVIGQEWVAAKHQIGTLGGGNHFIELQKSDKNELWIMIHSGSRNLGKKVCDYYNEIAVGIAKKYHIPDVVENELAYLPEDTHEGQSYILAMKYCVEFAYCNRKLMMDRVTDIIADVFKPQTKFDEMINIAHNYARLENHFGKNVWLHRKGATSARKGEIGIIPGSMGTKSYIVEGLGNPLSFESCSHGAGRRMGRGDASRTITLEEANKSMEGVIYGRWSKGRDGKLDFGEAPGAYKDIDVVMENQKELVKILVELKPLAVIKG